MYIIIIIHVHVRKCLWLDTFTGISIRYIHNIQAVLYAVQRPGDYNVRMYIHVHVVLRSLVSKPAFFSKCPECVLRRK